jgi:hypothetical protein
MVFTATNSQPSSGGRSGGKMNCWLYSLYFISKVLGDFTGIPTTAE